MKRSAMVLLSACGIIMLYLGLNGMVWVYDNFSQPGFLPFYFRPYIIPYWADCILYLLLLVSGTLCILSVVGRRGAGFIMCAGILGIISILGHWLLILVMFQNLYFPIKALVPLVVFAIGVWRKRIDDANA